MTSSSGQQHDTTGAAPFALPGAPEQSFFDLKSALDYSLDSPNQFGVHRGYIFAHASVLAEPMLPST
jgi:hypothetical protein